VDIPANIDGIPHVIHKPPGGEELKPHTDGMSMNRLISELEAHVASEDPSTMAWGQRYGLQCLAHLEGGRNDSGATYAIAPMTPMKLLVCLRAVRDGIVTKALYKGTTLDAWLNGGDGPTFTDWCKCLPEFNNVLANHGLEPISVCPIVPELSDGAFLACWVKHFPHGSRRNRKRRVSLTMPMNNNGMRMAEDARCVKRMRHLSRLAHGSSVEKEEAEEFLRNDTTPYYGGKTHKKPHLVARWFRPGAPYHSIAPTPEQVNTFVQAATL
jgi:hypothetical protein